MKRNGASGWAAILVLFGGSVLGCSDVGDSSAVPGGGGDDATADAMQGEAGATNPGAGDTAPGDTRAADMSTPEGGSGAADTGGADSSRDSTVPNMDSGSVSTGTPDTGGTVAPDADTGTVSAAPDSGTADANPDSGTPDAGVPDAGGPDSTVVDGGADAGVVDAGQADTGAVDSAGADAGTADAGTDSGGGPSPCITAPCATSGANSVHCAASPNGVCSVTEALIVSYDIANNGQGPGVNLPGSCYTCMIVNACLNGSGASPAGPAGNGSGIAVTNSECGDPNGAGSNPPFDNPNVSLTNVPQCLDALTCTLTSHGSPPNCTNSQLPPSVSNCYCGANTGASCLPSPAAAIGVCAANIATDIGSTDPTTVLSHFTDPTYSPGGVALAILNCALTAPATPPSAAKCPPCFH